MKFTIAANELAAALNKVRGANAGVERAEAKAEALAVFDRLLSEIDPKCTSVTIVAPMFPFAGSFGA